MAFFDKIGDLAGKIGDKASNIAQNIGDKTSEAIEVGKLNSKLNSERTAEGAALRQLGDYFYAKFRAGETMDEQAMELCRAVQAHTDAIANLTAEINAIKNNPAENSTSTEAVCPSCGAKLASGAKFCGECGQKIQ